MHQMFSQAVIVLSAVMAVTLLSVGQSSAVTLNVKDYGALADGKSDATAAFQKALDAAAKERGSTVYAPAGTYLVAGTIRVPPGATLKGDYSGPGGLHGTILLATGGKGKTEGPGCIVLSGGSGVRNIAIRYPEQTSDAKKPIPYPYAITADGYTRMEDIFLHNPYQGINLDGAHANVVRNIWGEPLKIGINVDHCYDISRIENVHFWPHFTLDKPLRAWVQQNGTAFQFGRSDWQYCFNTFCFGYHTGYRFYRTGEVKPNPQVTYPAGATNGNFVGIGADKCAIAIDVEDSFNIGVSITNGEFAPFGVTDSRGVLLRKGNTGNLTLVNCNFWAVPATLIEVQDGSLNLSACNIHEWAVAREGQPAMIAAGGRLNVNGCTFNRGGKLAILDGANTRAIFSGNMGTDPLTVVNHIGGRAVFAANNPGIKVVAGATPTPKAKRDG